MSLSADAAEKLIFKVYASLARKMMEIRRHGNAYSVLRLLSRLNVPLISPGCSGNLACAHNPSSDSHRKRFDNIQNRFGVAREAILTRTCYSFHSTNFDFYSYTQCLRLSKLSSSPILLSKARSRQFLRRVSLTSFVVTDI